MYCPAWTSLSPPLSSGLRGHCIQVNGGIFPCMDLFVYATILRLAGASLYSGKWGLLPMDLFVYATILRVTGALYSGLNCFAWNSLSTPLSSESRGHLIQVNIVAYISLHGFPSHATNRRVSGALYLGEWGYILYIAQYGPDLLVQATILRVAAALYSGTGG